MTKAAQHALSGTLASSRKSMPRIVRSFWIGIGCGLALGAMFATAAWTLTLRHENDQMERLIEDNERLSEMVDAEQQLSYKVIR